MARGIERGRRYAETVTGFRHRDLAALPSYSKFREALAALADESSAPLGRFLGDVRSAALSAPLGALCPSEGCGATAWPFSARRRAHSGSRITGRHRCPTCGHEFTATHDLEDVNWPT